MFRLTAMLKMVVLLVSLGLWGSRLNAAGLNPTEQANTGSAAQKRAAVSPALVKLESAQRIFVDAYVRAVNNRDRNALRKLIAPSVLNCYNGDSRIFLDDWLRRRIRSRISQNFQAVFAPYEGGLHESSMATVPAQATHILKITYQDGAQTVTIDRPVEKENSKWYLVLRCPTEKGRQRLEMWAQQRQEHVEELYSRLGDPLVARLRKLIREGRRDEAVSQCASALKVDKKTAHDVVIFIATQRK